VYASAKGIDTATVAITADEIVKLYYSLASEYRDNVCWVMAGATEGTIRGLTVSTQFPFAGNGGSNGGVGNGNVPQGAGWLVDARSRVFNSDEIDLIAASKKPLCVGNFSAGYAIIDRKYMTVLRDPYSEASKGLVNLWFHARFSGGIVDTGAFKHALTPTG
jgi:HK97 family phage major capsid protein